MADKFKKAKDLKVGDIIYCNSSGYSPVTRVNTVDYGGKTGEMVNAKVAVYKLPLTYKPNDKVRIKG